LIAEDDRAEGESVGEEILQMATEYREGERHNTRPWNHFAILFRSNPQSRIFEEALRMKGIPYRLVGSYSFLDRKEIKDLLSYWRLALSPKDDAAFRRVINWPPRGIGRGSVTKLGDWAFENEKSLWEASFEFEGLTPKIRKSLESFQEVIKKLQRALHTTENSSGALSEWGAGTLLTFAAAQGLEADYDDAEQVRSRMESMEELAQAVGQFTPTELPFPTTAHERLRLFLNHLLLQANEDEKDDSKDSEKDQVTLMTLHASKGLEFPVVFLAGMEDGLLPHKKIIEEAQDLSEERRLCYVGITRAKDTLYLVRARNRIRYGKAMPRNPSRFLSEVPRNLIEVKDLSSTPDLSSPEAREKHESRVKDFLSAIRSKIMDER